MNNIAAAHELDLKGLHCPMPLLKTKQALNGMESGQVVKVSATDPGSERDFITFSEQSGNLLLDFNEQEGIYTYWIQKK